MMTKLSSSDNLKAFQARADVIVLLAPSSAIITYVTFVPYGNGGIWRCIGAPENDRMFFLLSSLPTISSSGPCLFRVKIGVHTDIISLIERVFREACTTVNRLAYRRLEGNQGSFAAVSAFNLEHPFLERVESPLLVSS